MSKQNIAIIGLGRVGSAFLGAMLQKKQSISLVCVAERADTPAKAQAVANGVKVATLDEIVSMGDKIDIIFELTGMHETRKELREKLLAVKQRTYGDRFGNYCTPDRFTHQRHQTAGYRGAQDRLLSQCKNPGALTPGFMVSNQTEVLTEARTGSDAISTISPVTPQRTSPDTLSITFLILISLNCVAR